MKTLIINGTYHKNGMTATLTKSLEKGIKNVNPKADIKTIMLLEQEPEYCKGCNTCQKEKKKSIGTCAIKDDVRKTLENMTKYDVIVFASPIYEFCVTALMKKFYERCLPLFKFERGISGRNKKSKKRIGVIMLSSGAPTPFNTILRMSRYPVFVGKFILKSAGCGSIKKFIAGAMENNKKTKEKYANKAYKLGQKIANLF